MPSHLLSANIVIFNAHYESTQTRFQLAYNSCTAVQFLNVCTID
jgi:hypothetical protein